MSTIESRYPVLHIWRVNQPADEGAAGADPGEGGDSLLIVRGERGVDIERLRPGEAALLRAFAADAPLNAAAARASDTEPSFDLSAALRRHVANHVLVAFRAPQPSVEGSLR